MTLWVPGSLAYCCLFPAVVPGRCNRQGPITKSPSEGETVRHQHFSNPPIFLWVTNIFQTRLSFCESANIFQVRLFLKNAKNLWICLIFVAANICVYFQYLFMHLSIRQYFWCNCFNLRFKIDIVVMIIWSIVIIINGILIFYLLLLLRFTMWLLLYTWKDCECELL